MKKFSTNGNYLVQTHPTSWTKDLRNQWYKYSTKIFLPNYMNLLVQKNGHFYIKMMED